MTRLVPKKIKEILMGDGSLSLDEIIQKYTADPYFPWLISFPRTGSHWLRIVMELYFEKPGLTRVFYYKDATDFTCYHQHDEDLTRQGMKNVIYLYRHPVDTVFSQLNYYKEDVGAVARIEYWSALYGRHLKKWLFDEEFTEKKTVITYEGMKASMPDEFRKVCEHLGYGFDGAKLEAALARVSKAELKKKTRDDGQIINLSDNYQSRREEFRQRHARLVMDAVSGQDPRVGKLFVM